ncbi:MAG: dicarboxylate/amino acid:cation symporter [Gemmatimonadetes bacterium]|nr:dicarboxylate/amino acid:cation symporter [Gemmatimonadota bacterium]NNK64597.1 dicarboxylate/amino acid:cation symporter [Gemmatimonadota bacterium]
MQLYTKIMIALIVGVAAGLVANLLDIGSLVAFFVAIGQFGDAWIDLITMVVIPLVVASLVVGTASLGDITKVGRIGGKTVVYYLVTTAIAVSIGLVLSNIFLRGDAGMSAEALEGLRGQYLAEGQSRVAMAEQAPGLVEVLRGIIPRNIVEALANFEMLPILFFSIFFGAALSSVPKETRDPVLRFFDGVNEAAMVMIHWIMALAPYAVFALIAAVIAEFGAEVLGGLLVYSLVVVAGLLLHLIITYGAALRFLAGVKPLDFLKKIRAVQLVAFSTSSSNATLPLTIETAEEEVGISNEVSSFVLPLGATINMDGTALYQAVATMFIATVLVGDLTLAAQFTIVLTATLASIGAAGVPSAGIIILIVVLQQALPPTVDPAAGIALILGVDRILDMCRTALNVTGDLTAAAVVARSEGETLALVQAAGD